MIFLLCCVCSGTIRLVCLNVVILYRRLLSEKGVFSMQTPATKIPENMSREKAKTDVTDVKFAKAVVSLDVLSLCTLFHAHCVCVLLK